MGQIIGDPADPEDSDPVELRAMEIWGTTLWSDLAGSGYGNPATSPIYYWQMESGYQWWQYYNNGMIAAGVNSCACVIYGPIYEYYDGQGQFQGPLGFPTSDVKQMSDGSQYAVFDNAVLWADAQGNVTPLHALSPGLIQSLSVSPQYPSGVNPTIGGITQIAQQKVQAIANNALQTNQQLKDNVSSITTTVTFDSVGVGSCANMNPAVSRAYTFNIHFEFGLTGCGGMLGSGNADTTVVLQMALSGQSVQAFMRTYNIDDVGSPFGAGNDQITAGLTQAFSSEYGQDLLGVTVPTGFSVLAVIVDNSGNANIYIAPICSASTALARVDPALAGDSLTKLRRLRDGFILREAYGQDLIRLIDVVGPIFIARMRLEPKSLELSTAMASMLTGVDPDSSDVHRELNAIAPRLIHLQQVAGGRATPALDRILVRAIEFVRANTRTSLSFAHALREFRPLLEAEIAAVESASGR